MSQTAYVKDGEVVLQPKEYFTNEEVIKDIDRNPEKKETENEFFRTEKIILAD